MARYCGPKELARRGQKGEAYPGGAQKIRTIARAFLSAGHKVSVLSAGAVLHTNKYWAPFAESADFPEGRVEIIYCPLLDYRGAHRLVAQWSLPRLLRQTHRDKRIDAIVLYNVGEETLAVAATARKLGIPTVLEYEDDALLSRSPRSSLIPWRKWFYTRVLKKLNRTLDGAFVVCPELADQLATKNVALLRGALDPELIWATKQQPPPLLVGEPARIVFCGALTPDKGADLLLESLFHVRYPCELHLVGGGFMQTNLQRRAFDLPAHHRATVHGFTPRCTMLKLMGEAHVLVNPHRMYDEVFGGRLFPFKLVEYAATGVPIVSSSLGKPDEVWMSPIHFYQRDDATGLADALNLAIASHEVVSRQMTEARAMVRSEYCLQSLAGRLCKVVGRAVDSNCNKRLKRVETMVA